MATNRLYQVLIEHSGLDRGTLDSLVADLDDPDDARALGSRVVERGLMSFSAIMELALTHDLFPRTEAVLKRLTEARRRHQVIKPQKHSTRYKLSGDEHVVETLDIKQAGVSVPIPQPNLSLYSAISTDERQVVEMAVELVNIRQYQEAEMFLIDARDEFPGSVRVSVVLIWLYLRCHCLTEARTICASALTKQRDDVNLMEFAGLADQALGKHLLAINHYHKLICLPRAKPIWYLLLAISLERARLYMDAGHNYRIFMSLSSPDDLRTYAESRLNHLAT